MSSSAGLAERLAGGVWGHLVGDAVGVPYEFGPPRPAASVVFGATGTHDQRPGTWSDDGALMLSLLDSMLEVGFDVDDQGRRAVAWYRKGAYTPDGDGYFDIGGTTGTALRGIEHGTPTADAGPTGERDNGNGSLMRILPIALIEREADEAILVDHAERASRVTHGHPRSQVACALYTLVVTRLLAGESDRTAALADARARLERLVADRPAHREALEHLLGYSGRAGMGVVWDSFWSAWDAFAGADSYSETIQRAVAYGNDTDTTAAIAGGLAGTYWGLSGIPHDWLAAMRGREVVEPLVTRLTKSFDPIRVDYVDLRTVPGLAKVPGRLGMTFAPGKRDGSHRRDLVFDVGWLRSAWAVDTFVLLIEDFELDLLHIPDVVERLNAAGIEVIRFPIVDVSVPTDRPALGALLGDIRERLAAGQNVAVACRGGIGRTGTVVGCLLRDGGLGGEEAILQTRAARPGTMETLAQEDFVREWGP